MEWTCGRDAIMELQWVLSETFIYQGQRNGDNPQEFRPAHSPARTFNQKCARAAFPNLLPVFRVCRPIRVNPHGIIDATPVKDVFIVGPMVSELIPRCNDGHVHKL